MARAPRKKTAKRKTAKKKAVRKTAPKKATKRAARKTPKKAAGRTATKRKVAKKATPKKAATRKARAKKAAVRSAAARRNRSAGTSRVAGPRINDDLMLRLEIEELHAAYSYALDHGDIDTWPDLFTDDCIYKLISRENWDLGLPLGTMFAEGRGGLLDRVNSVKQTTVYHERYLAHMISNTRVLSEKNGVVEASANYMVLETLPNQYTKILNAGRYIDKIVRQGGKLKFKEKIAIYDSVLVPASIITPI